MAKKQSKTSIKNLNETGKRIGEDRRQTLQAGLSQPERRKNKRRRQIDPTTCEREYDNAEIEFMHALDEYKRASGRMFPTCSEILEVLVGLGYRQVAAATEGFTFQQESDGTQATDDEFEGELLEGELDIELEDQVV